jgi:transcriptional regulator with XRE-family HTH domain
MARLQFNEILRKRLEGKNLSAVARELKISKSLIADWVGARRAPSMKNIEAVYRLANYLGLSLEELLLGTKAREVKTLVSAKFEDEGNEYRIHISREK